MSLPFTLDQFLRTFREYNDAIGFAPVAMMLMALGMIALASARMDLRHRLISALMAMLWLWAGLIYHLMFFATINPAGKFFSALFVLQAILLIAYGVVRGALTFEPTRTVSGFTGTALIAYGLFVYPVLGWVQGHGYPDGPSFGAPCPTVIFTIGFLFWTTGRIPVIVALVPLLWSAVGSSAAVQLAMFEDLGLTAAGLLLLVEMVRRRGTRTRTSTPAPAV